MKIFTLISRDGIPFLRQKNVLAGTNLVSPQMQAEHEKLFEDSALPLLNGIDGKNEYTESEVAVVWQFLDGKNWIDISEPNLIESGQYRQVFVYQAEQTTSFQDGVAKWLVECFGQKVAHDKTERNYRFMEEALELVQSLGMSKEDVLRVVMYVFNRPAGEPFQEVGGVMVTLAALSSVNGIDMIKSGEAEAVFNWLRIDELRSKQQNRISYLN